MWDKVHSPSLLISDDSNDDLEQAMGRSKLQCLLDNYSATLSEIPTLCHF